MNAWGKLPNAAPGIGIYFFGEQTEITSSAEQAYEQVFGFIELAASG